MKRQKLLPHLLLFFFLFLFAGNLFAQQVSNISFKQDGDKVVISYDIDGKTGDLFNSTGYYSIDEGKNWTQLVTVTGDLVNVSPGSEKKIYWEVLKDVTGIKGSISFKVEATRSKETAFDMKGFFLAAELLGGRTGFINKKWGFSGTALSGFILRSAFYVSITRNIITKRGFKWNAGPLYGRIEYSFYNSDNILDWGYGPGYGITNELLIKKLYFNIDVFYSPWEEDMGTVFPTVGIGIVF
jgi:hypothetical protein